MNSHADVEPMVHVEAVVLRAQPCSYHAEHREQGANPNGFASWCPSCLEQPPVRETVVFEES